MDIGFGRGKFRGGLDGAAIGAFEVIHVNGLGARHVGIHSRSAEDLDIAARDGALDAAHCPALQHAADALKEQRQCQQGAQRAWIKKEKARGDEEYLIAEIGLNLRFASGVLSAPGEQHQVLTDEVGNENQAERDPAAPSAINRYQQKRIGNGNDRRYQ